MARFIVAHRLANRPADASRSNFEAASSKLRSFADVKVAARPSPGGRGLMVIDTDSADLSRKAREFSHDVITEPELQRYPSTTVGAALRGGRDRVAAALLAHPLIGQFGPAQDMADRLIAENATFLSWA